MILLLCWEPGGTGNIEGLKRKGRRPEGEGEGEWMRFIRWERQSLVGLVWIGRCSL